MEEIKELHNNNFDWPVVMALMNKISDLLDTISGGWNEAEEMLADAVEVSSKEPSERIFYVVYQFMFRFYYRLKNNNAAGDFNQVSMVEINDSPYYRITNYDFKTYRWAKEHDFLWSVSNAYMDIPKDKLSVAQQKALDSKIR